MSLIIFGRTLPQNKKIIYALTELYGIGLPSSLFICRDLGFKRTKIVEAVVDIAYGMGFPLMGNVPIRMVKLRVSIFINKLKVN